MLRGNAMTNKHFMLLCILLAACPPPPSAATPTGAQPADVAAEDTATSEPEAVATVAPAATATEEQANRVIAPETLGQLRFFWNAEFPGEINTSDVNIGCDPGQEICTFQTSITNYAFSPDGNNLAVGVCEGLRTVDQTNRNKDFFGCTGERVIILYDSITGKERGRLAPAALPLSLA